MNWDLPFFYWKNARNYKQNMAVILGFRQKVTGRRNLNYKVYKCSWVKVPLLLMAKLIFLFFNVQGIADRAQ